MDYGIVSLRDIELLLGIQEAKRHGCFESQFFANISGITQGKSQLTYQNGIPSL